jgi:hypothetical protein
VSDFVIFNPVNLFQSCGIELIRQEPTLLRPTKETNTSGVRQEFFSSIRQQGVVTLLNLMRVSRVSQLKSCGGDDFAPRLHG